MKIGDLRSVVVAAVRDGLACVASHLDERFVIEECEGLERRVRCFPAGDTSLAAWPIKGAAHREWGRPFHECINASSMAILALACRPSSSAIGRLGRAGGLRWIYGRSVHL